MINNYFAAGNKMASLKQQTYRRLMKEQKTKSTAVQRIQHPLAK